MSARAAALALLLSVAPATAREPAEDDCLMQPTVYRYLASAQDKMLDGWRLPDDVLANREVVVRLAFDADGSLREVAIEGATDRRVAQSVALAILSAEPFEPLPRGAECLVGLRVRTTFRNPAN